MHTSGGGSGWGGGRLRARLPRGLGRQPRSPAQQSRQRAPDSGAGQAGPPSPALRPAGKCRLPGSRPRPASRGRGPSPHPRSRPSHGAVLPSKLWRARPPEGHAPGSGVGTLLLLSLHHRSPWEGGPRPSPRASTSRRPLTQTARSGVRVSAERPHGRLARPGATLRPASV